METSDKKAVSTRRKLLLAAGQVILKAGVNHLTLDAVAHEAQVSKGGLLYHFPSKEALVQALVQQLVDVFFERVDAELQKAAEPEGTPGRWLRAYVRATFAADPHEYEVSAALSVAVATEPEMLTALRTCFERMRDLGQQDGLEPSRAALIRLAADGLWYGEVLQMAPLGEPLRSQLFDHLMRLTEGK